MDASGRQRWHDDFGDGEAWTAPATEVLDHVAVPEIFATSKTVVIHGEPLASVFRPTDGELQWAAVVGHRAAVAPDASDGLLVATGDSATSPAAAQATVYLPSRLQRREKPERRPRPADDIRDRLDGRHSPAPGAFHKVEPPRGGVASGIFGRLPVAEQKVRPEQ